jgi:hypothetical protein
MDLTPRLSAVNGTTWICFTIFQHLGMAITFYLSLVQSLMVGDDDSDPAEPRMIGILSAESPPLRD